ncbi:hypothetical protein F0562_001372 [Nyssa sinensis]|uniref:Uncharacterized protein n=1 Tax=Nyssa sinensis TaxID=561372 RepID=A0A5J5C6M3_9ASTE|nr:hypothetical protein F0562_001372 [Nyssa sinensis]
MRRLDFFRLVRLWRSETLIGNRSLAEDHCGSSSLGLRVFLPAFAILFTIQPRVLDSSSLRLFSSIHFSVNLIFLVLHSSISLQHMWTSVISSDEFCSISNPSSVSPF